MALAGLGTDTGGSCRVPAAMCGITGYKPTARRVPLTGVLPLSRSLDSIGPLANTVACCATIDAVLAGETPVPITPLDVSGLRLAVPENIVFEGADETVLGTFDRALARLEKAGARIIRRRFSGLDDVAIANRTGGFAAPEAFAQHRALLAKRGDGYDPHVRRRIERGGEMHVADYIALAAERIAVITRMNAQTAPYDALVMPTCPLAPPAIAPLEADDEEYRRVNLLQLRNTALGNFLDRCAISLPCHAPGDPPVGFMVMGETMGDAKLFAIAAAIEAAIR
jgi:aspartyl-tRNA(Asn)/glutamyl-tRNA(Gln) amidotransferase subunit A